MMGNVVPDVDIKRPGFVLLDEGNGLVEDMGVAAPRVVTPFFARRIVGVDDVDAVLAGLWIGADVPLTKMPGRITLLLQQFRDGHFVPKATISWIFRKRRRQLRRHEPCAAGAAG